MTNQCQVIWLHRSKVYHRANGIRWSKDGMDGFASCGTQVCARHFRAMEATEHTAQVFGLRRCRRCAWPSTANSTQGRKDA